MVSDTVDSPRNLFDQISENPSLNKDKINLLLSLIEDSNLDNAVSAARYIEKLVEKYPAEMEQFADTIAQLYFESKNSPASDVLQRKMSHSLRTLIENSPVLFNNDTIQCVFNDILELTPGTEERIIRDSVVVWRIATENGRTVKEDVINACAKLIDSPGLLQSKDEAIKLLEAIIRSGQKSERAIIALLLALQSENERTVRSAFFALARISVECPAQVTSQGLGVKVKNYLQEYSPTLDVSSTVVEESIASLEGEQ